MKRKIIRINETKCTGCGQCIPDCPEGALQLIEGKARLVSDLFCDGLGACIGTCPEGAITVIEREAAPYDERAVMGTIVKQGIPVVKAHLEHLAGHGQLPFYNLAIEYLIENGYPIPDHTPPEQGTRPAAAASASHPPAERMGEGGCHQNADQKRPFAACPGSAARTIPREPGPKPRQPSGAGPSELRQWPIQLALLNPSAPYFGNADLLISADCVPFSYPGFHQDFLKGKILIMFCPKLDHDIEGYIGKLSLIFSRHSIRSITLLHMEVPCCGGVRYVVDKALEKAGITLAITEKTITIDGNVK